MEKKLRYRLTKQQRFERMLAKVPGEDPIFPVFLHSIERYLLGETDLSEADMIIRKSLQRYPNISRDMLQTWVGDWHSIPETIKRQFVPVELQDLKASRKLDMEAFRGVISRLSWRLPGLSVRRRYRLSNSALVSIGSGLVTLAPAAKITSIAPTDPDGSPYAYIGGPFSIRGEGFSPKNEENVIVIYLLIGGVPQAQIGIFPTKSSPDKLEATAPGYTEVGKGRYAVAVAVKGKSLSNLVEMSFLNPPGEKGTINTISPGSQFPGKMVLIDGRGFNRSPRVFWKALEPGLEGGECYGTDVEWLSDIQLKMVVPERFVDFPGKYLIAVAGPNQPLSNWKEIDIRPFKYTVEFRRIKCIDESNPESWWQADEIVAKWAIACDGQAWSKQSSEYTEFNDGTEKSFSDTDKSVFLPTGGAGEVKRGLIIGTLLLEWDEGDVKAWTEALDFCADFVAKLPLGDWQTYVKWALKGLSKLVSWLGGDPDGLGESTLTWAVSDLYEKTKKEDLQFKDKISFLNDDDTGSYELLYAVTRLEQ